MNESLKRQLKDSIEKLLRERVEWEKVKLKQKLFDLIDTIDPIDTVVTQPRLKASTEVPVGEIWFIDSRKFIQDQITNIEEENDWRFDPKKPLEDYKESSKDDS